MPDMRYGLQLRTLQAFADPREAVRVAVAAEEAGWEALLVWDHLAWASSGEASADPWVTLGACAAVTSRIQLGTAVTPLPRRRPHDVAQQLATLSLLSGGRVVFGAGLGGRAAEFERFGEDAGVRRRAAMLDEGLDVVAALLTGEQVDHRGEHYTVDGIQFLPRPARQTVPVWVAGFPGKIRPLRRAARHDGFFPVNLQHPGQLAETAATITGLRQHTTAPYDIAVALPPGTDLAPYAKAGATWWLTEFEPEAVSLDQLRGVLRDGPAVP